MRPVAAAVQPRMAPKTETISASKAATPTPNAKEHVTNAVSQSQTKIEVKQEPTKHMNNNVTGKPPAMKQEHSDIFKSFSKAKSKVAGDQTNRSFDASPAPETPQSVRVSTNNYIRMILTPW